MASLAHVAVGLAAGRPARARIAFAVLSMLPDLDVIAFHFGIPYSAPFGHRGATHSLLDALTDGGLGVALLWPFSNERFFAPWRPIPVAPIGAGMLSSRGLHVLLIEGLWSLPLLVFAFWPPRRNHLGR